MIYLLFAIISSVFIAHIFKFADKKNISIFGIMAINYGIATGISFYQSPTNPLEQPTGSIVLGAFLGVLFFATFVLLMVNIQRSGLNIPVSLMRLSAVIPTIGSIMIFSEVPNQWQTVGIFIAFLAIPFSAPEKPSRNNFDQFFHSGFLFGILLFLSFGINDFCLKIQTEIYPEVHDSSFLVIVFLSALAMSIIAVLFYKIRLNMKIIFIGIILGIVNYASTIFFLFALEYVPGMIIYPLNGISIIILTAFSSYFVWKEKPANHNYLFFVFAIIALALIY